MKNAALPGDQVVLLPLGTGLQSFSFTLPLRGEKFETHTAEGSSPFAKVLSEDLAHLAYEPRDALAFGAGLRLRHRVNGCSLLGQ